MTEPGAIPAEGHDEWSDLLQGAESAEVAASLFGAFAVPPPPELRERVLARVAEPDGLTVLRADEPGWFDLGPPGIRVRVLFRDPNRRSQTLLMEVAPGATLPSHGHDDAEECFVVRGEFESFGRVFRAGDYVRAPAGSHHGVSRSATGCLLLLTAGIDAAAP